MVAEDCCADESSFPAMMPNWTEIDWFPLWLSLRVAVIATALSLAFGLTCAYVLARFRFRGRDALDAVITLPIVLPPTVLGYYLLVLLGRSSPFGRIFESVFGAALVFTWQAAVLAAMLHSIPLLVKSARAALEGVDRSLENAARTMGASESRIFFRITLPLAKRSILAATAFAFARALGDFGVTIMIAGNIPGRTQTLAVAIYDAVQSGRSGPALAMVLTISAITLAVLYLTNRLQGEVLH
jgi:molybdate transport system permease protein